MTADLKLINQICGSDLIGRRSRKQEVLICFCARPGFRKINARKPTHLFWGAHAPSRAVVGASTTTFSG
jgi:hypothetical protein